MALDDRAPRLLYKLALAYYRNGQAALAIEPLRRALALDDRFAEAHYLLAMCLRDRKRDAEAVKSLTRALQINPAFGAAREELADLDPHAGQDARGIEQLEALAALEPARPQRMVNVGLAYARLGRTDAAITTLGRAAERYPEADAVYIALGRVWLDDRRVARRSGRAEQGARGAAARRVTRHGVERHADALRAGRCFSRTTSRQPSGRSNRRRQRCRRIRSRSPTSRRRRSAAGTSPPRAMRSSST